MTTLLDQTKQAANLSHLAILDSFIIDYGIKPWDYCKFDNNSGWLLSENKDEKVHVNYTILYSIAKALADHISYTYRDKDEVTIYGVPRGGVPCACMLLHALNDDKFSLVENVINADIVIDDVVDSGKTKIDIMEVNNNCKFYAFFVKPSNWIVFPYEGSESNSIEDAFIRLSQFYNIREENYQEFSDSIQNYIITNVMPEENYQDFSDGK